MSTTPDSCSNQVNLPGMTVIAYQGETITVEFIPERRYPTSDGNVIVEKAKHRAAVGERTFVGPKSLVTRLAKQFVRCGCDEATFAKERGF